MDELLVLQGDNITMKVHRAITLLKSVGTDIVEVSYSGGKDSDVVLELCKMAGINYRIIHKCTTIDPPYTLTHCVDMGAEIIKPQKTMFQLIRERGFPTRRARFCCEHLKEYKVLSIAVQGIRRAESTKRASLYKEPIICRFYGNKKEKAQIILPILDWTDLDVKRFISMRGLKLHPLYYSDGKIDISRRLGCIGCPLASDNGLSDFKQYPKMVKAWLKNGEIWWNNHPNTKSHKKFRNIYELFVHNLFFKSYDDFYNAVNAPIGGVVDCKKMLEDYFDIKL